MTELLRRGYQVVNLDLRGHGDSQWAADGVYSAEALSGDIDAVVSSLQTPPALVGASMGGMASLFYAGTRAAEKTSALVLVDIVPMFGASGARKVAAFLNDHLAGFADLQQAADAIANYNPHRPRPLSHDGLLKNLRQRNGRWYWHWDPALVRGRERASLPDYRNQLGRAASKVRVPTLLVRGLMSDMVTDEGVADLKARLPQLEVYDVRSAGHMVAGDDNDAFNEGVCGFLQRHLPVVH
jgi:pimeloyl-ACP methyl ester carboxylesterase